MTQLEILVVILVLALVVAIALYVLIWAENRVLREALGRFASINLCYPLDQTKIVWDILNARKALGGKRK